MSRFLPLAPPPEPVCADCIAHDGLCASHRHDALPSQLKPLRSNWPVHLMGVSYYDERKDESDDARRHRERKAKKRAKAAARLGRAIAGDFTRSARAA